MATFPEATKGTQAKVYLLPIDGDDFDARLIQEEVELTDTEGTDQGFHQQADLKKTACGSSQMGSASMAISKAGASGSSVRSA